MKEIFELIAFFKKDESGDPKVFGEGDKSIRDGVRGKYSDMRQAEFDVLFANAIFALDVLSEMKKQYDRIERLKEARNG